MAGSLALSLYISFFDFPPNHWWSMYFFRLLFRIYFSLPLLDARACASRCFVLTVLFPISAAWYQVKWWHDYQRFDGGLCQISLNTYQTRNSWTCIDRLADSDFVLLSFTSHRLISSHAQMIGWWMHTAVWLLSMPLSVINVVIVSAVGGVRLLPSTSEKQFEWISCTHKFKFIELIMLVVVEIPKFPFTRTSTLSRWKNRNFPSNNCMWSQNIVI